MERAARGQTALDLVSFANPLQRERLFVMGPCRPPMVFEKKAKERRHEAVEEKEASERTKCLLALRKYDQVTGHSGIMLILGILIA